ncbi:RHE_PE00001 family protein, partial [Pseudorhodoplanes sp.]|uniref:RHE_PE00001 family protein n=1 Tax=Pseudorhodoplanes sp. TaxID=1934341 RepID=UPI003D14EC09
MKATAEDQLARLDEQVRRSPAGEGFVERGHFFDAAASMWVGGELVHVEDLVLHDERMDVRAPTHELTIAHRILRARRRIAGDRPGWAVSDAGIGALTGYDDQDRAAAGEGSSTDETAEPVLIGDDDPLAQELASVDALLEQSQQLIDRVSATKREGRSPLVVGDLVVRDSDWDEADRLAQWRRVLQEVADLPPTLAAALIWDAWETLEPMQRQHWLGSQFVSAHLRARGKVASHLFGFNVGLKAVPRERR